MLEASLRSAMTLRTRRPKGCAAFRCRIVTSWPAAISRLTRSLPMKSVPPITRTRIGLVVILEAEVRDQLLALHPAKRILQLHGLDEDVMLRVESRGRHW